MSITPFAVTFDARDAEATATFWAEALGRSVEGGADETSATVAADPAIPASRIGFRQVPEDKKAKNRMHFDFVTGDFDAEVTRLTALGATELNEVDAGIHTPRSRTPRATSSM